MNKKKCPQCKNLISPNAPTCLYCGRPNKFVTNKYVKNKWNKVVKNSNISKFKRLILIYVLLIFIIILIIFLITLYK